jgi:hypothetical protein
MRMKARGIIMDHCGSSESDHSSKDQAICQWAHKEDLEFSGLVYEQWPQVAAG